MPVGVTFSIYVDDELCLNIDSINQQLDQYKQALLSYRHDGTLLIYDIENTSSSISIEDEIQYQIPQLCFKHLIDLINNKEVVIKAWSHLGYTRLQPKEKWIRISGKHISEGQFLKSELLIALFHCGLQYLDLLQRLNDNEQFFSETIRLLESEAQEAKKNLKKQKII